VALLGVRFVGVIDAMRAESLSFTVGEFEEWGNPKIPLRRAAHRVAVAR
jgi:protease II